MKTVLVLMPIFHIIVCKPSELISAKTVIAGTKLSLPCELSRRDESVVLWKKDDRVLFAGDLRVRKDERFSVDDGDLHISYVTIANRGEYTCEIESEGGELSSATYVVKVLQQPEAMIDIGSQLTVKSGTHLAVTCSGSGVPLPEVRWRRGETVLAVGTGEAELVLEFVTRKNIGDFVCEASNDVGNADEETLALDVLYAPEIAVLKYDISFQPKCGMEFQCLVHSSSTPTVQWFHNDLLLQPKDGITMWNLDNLHVLQIHSCDQKLLGHFTCRAESMQGKDHKDVFITEEIIEEEILQVILEEDISNNVRRNVQQQEALPLVSSSSFCLPSILLIVFAFIAR